MRLLPEIQEKLTKDILRVIGKHLNLTEYRIFLFGSRVTEKGSERSDIDVGIEGKEPIPGHIFTEILEDLENLRTLYKIDLVDFQQVSDEFRAIALQKIEIIHPS